MKKSIVLIFITCSTTFLFGQKVTSKQTETSKPFVLGVIDEIQSKELSEKRILNILTEMLILMIIYNHFYLFLNFFF